MNEVAVIPLTLQNQPCTAAIRQPIYKFIIGKPEEVKAFIRKASQKNAEALLQACIAIARDAEDSEGWEAV